MNLFAKTITSLITAPITQNIALIRISGPTTYRIIAQIFDRSLPLYPQSKPQLIFGKIVNSHQQIIDQVLLLCFYKPSSFTGEDVVEISCHGNLLIVNQIIQLILEKGAELAQPGEFTKQAFFNHKLNLVQAEAVNDLIKAPSLSGVQLALHNLDSTTQVELDNLEKELLDIITNLMVNIDYPEYNGAQYLTGQMVLPRLIKLVTKLQLIQQNGQKGQVYQSGLKIALIGKPNVGKSTLLNSLTNEEKAIVSPMAGTTRDIVEARYTLKSIPLVLLDTAGIHATADLVEQIGVKRSYQALEEADLVFFCVDNTTSWGQEEENIYQKIKNRNYLLVINKMDEPSAFRPPSFINAEKFCRISAKQHQLVELENKIEQLFASDLISSLPTYPVLSSSWQQVKLTQLIQQLTQITKALKKKVPLDAVCSDLEISYKIFQELSGKEYQEDLLDIVFSKFCLGK